MVARRSGRRRLSRRARAVRTVVLVAVVGAAIGIGVGWKAGGVGAPVHHVRRHVRTVAATRPYLGPDGVVSPAIVAENRRRGATGWRITHQPSGGLIEGWASTTAATVGQRVGIYVTTTAPSFTVLAYRMGYYQGKGARLIWASRPVPGRVQPACPVAAGVNTVSCANWRRSLSMRVASAFVQGDYLLKLVASTGRQSYVPLTIWEPSSTAAYLVVARSLTEEGWNLYGGYSFYAGRGPCTLGQTTSYPPCNRARIVSFDRPYLAGTGASDFLGDEYPLVRFMEHHGLDAAYVTDVVLSEHPGIVLQHRVVLSLGHDETWTTPERLGLERGLADGVNVAFFGAAPLVRHARLEPSWIGPAREVVDYRDPSEDPLRGAPRTVTGNTFATPPTSWPPTALVGGEYSGYVLTGAPAAPFVVYDASAWIFSGTGLHDGSTVPDVIRSDIEHLEPSTTPADLEVLGHSPVPLASAYTNQGSWAGKTYSDMTYYTDQASGAGVFESGTVSWISRLTVCARAPGPCPARVVARMTGNLLRAFGQGPAGRYEAPTPNWRSLAPPGS